MSGERVPAVPAEPARAGDGSWCSNAPGWPNGIQFTTSPSDPGRAMTDEINANPVEVADLRRSMQQVREGDVRWLDDGESISDVLDAAAPASLAETREAAAKEAIADVIHGVYGDVAADAGCSGSEAQAFARTAAALVLAALSAPPAPTEPAEGTVDLDDPEWGTRVAAARAQGDTRPASMFRRPGFATDDEDDHPAPPAAPTEDATFWNGEPAYAARCIAIIGESPPGWWCSDLAGQQRNAVIVEYGGRVFFIDDAYGGGWDKVTAGRGLPSVPHRNLPPDSKYVRGSRDARVAAAPTEEREAREALALDALHSYDCFGDDDGSGGIDHTECRKIVRSVLALSPVPSDPQEADRG